jgi:inhibitor of KinA
LINKLTAIFPLHYSISSLNEAALLVSFDNILDERINDHVMALQQAVLQTPFKGFIETVPAYASLAIFYDLAEVKNNNTAHITAFDFLKYYTEQLLLELKAVSSAENKPPVEIPVYYNGEDLVVLAKLHQLSVEEVIRLHTEKTVRVFMIGFLPGFAYMGKVDERIATPRLAIPRTRVKPGSVGIAGSQTGIYPLASPGGWQLVGQTPLKIFDVNKETPCLLQAGDRVQFISISKTDFENLNEYQDH